MKAIQIAGPGRSIAVSRPASASTPAERASAADVRGIRRHPPPIARRSTVRMAVAAEEPARSAAVRAAATASTPVKPTQIVVG